MELVPDRKGHDFKYQLSTKHNLSAVKKQKKFNLSQTVKYYVNKYRS
jgi:dTDP-D-glucose 4,6-dehydratase